MTNLFKESLILSSIYRCLIFLHVSFQESFTYNFFRNISFKFKYLVSNSRFWNYFYKRDRLDQLWKDSLLNRVFSFILNIPTKLMRFIHKKLERFLVHSYIYSFLVFLSSKLHFIFGLVLILTLIVPAHMWFNAYGVLTVFGLFGLYLIKTMVDEEFDFSLDNYDLANLVFSMAIVLAFVLSLFPRVSLNDFVYFSISFLALLILVNSTNNRKELDRVVDGLVFGIILTALYGIYQWKVVGIEIDPSLTDLAINQGMGGRVFSTMGNPNVYGEILILCMPFIVTRILNSKGFFRKSFYSLGFLLSLVVLLKTGSRSAWVAFAICMGSFVFFREKKLLPVFIVLGALMLPFLPDSIYRRMMTIFNPNDTSLNYRKKIVGPALIMLKEFWLTGVGLGTNTFMIMYKKYKSFGLSTVAHTHNLFLQVWLETGILGLLSLLWLGFRLIKKTVYVIKNSSDKNLQNIAIAGISALAGIIIMGFADHIWFYNRILFIFWIVVAIILTSYKLTIKEEEKNPNIN